MVESDRTHSGRRRRWSRVGVIFVVVLLVLAGAAYWLDLGDRLGISPDPATDPAAVAPPPGLDLPEQASPAPVAAPLAGGALDRAAVRRALGRLPDDRKLGRRVGLLVADLDGDPALRHGPDRVTPASTMKLLTTLSALEVLGPEHRFTTEAVAKGRRVTLVGGGDPLLGRSPDSDGYPATADVTTLARQAARALRKHGSTRVRLTYDDTLFAGPAASPDWEPDYLPDDVVSPITALWVDEGRVQPGQAYRTTDPSGDAAAAFAAALESNGVSVVGRVQPGRAPRAAHRVGAVHSAELVEIVQHILEWSDNEGAEVLARHVALAEGEPGSFTGGATAVRSVLGRLGVPLGGAVILDGSGLSRGNVLQTRTLLGTLVVAAHDPRLEGLLEGLPVAGFSGSLGYRFENGADPALGLVRAKTGTLTGVHGLAGVVTGRDGSVMLFVAVADRVRLPNTLYTRDRLDQIAAALADCTCGAG